MNLRGRAAQGIVSSTEADAPLDELAEKLEAWRDGRIVRRAFRGSRIYSGARAAAGGPQSAK